MLACDHNFDVNHLEVKYELKRLLHLETFNTEPPRDLIFFTGVGRLVEQKSFELVVDIIKPTLDYYAGVKLCPFSKSALQMNKNMLDEK
jgi:glycogen synthase